MAAIYRSTYYLPYHDCIEYKVKDPRFRMNRCYPMLLLVLLIHLGVAD